MSGDLEKVKGKEEAKRQESERAAGELSLLTDKVTKLKDDLAERDQLVGTLRAEKGELAEEVAELKAKVEKSFVNFEQKIWDRPLTEQPLNYVRKRDKRKAVIVAFFNLKGGVGKTTVTGNLGASLIERNSKMRLLLVDLDHQQSLSKTCLTDTQLEKLKTGGPSTARLFGADAANLPQQFSDSLLPIAGRSGRFQIAPSRPELEENESSSMVKWLESGHEGEDVRVRLAKALSSHVDEFDYIFLDCPPRFTTGTVNALACCDAIIVPLGPTMLSTDPVPELVKKLEAMESLLSVLSPKCLGLIMNLVDGKASLGKDLNDIISECSDRWIGRMWGFEQRLTRYIAYDHAAQNRADGHRKFALDIDKKPAVQLDALATEFESKLNRA